MNASSLESKTIRPGSLGNYSYYHSARRPAPAPSRPAYIAASRHRLIPHAKVLLVMIVVVGLGFGGSILQSRASNSTKSSSQQSTVAASATPKANATKTVVAPPAKASAAPAVLSATTSNKCAGNTEDKQIYISISKRRLWACDHTKLVRESAVITGMLAHESTLTPPGTYKIYGKTTDTTLTGADETGSWNRPVYYWMPFLDNEHGTYGFHDATWRADKEFGKVDPKSDKASHGCIELPLGATKWLYGWAPVGTALTVET